MNISNIHENSYKNIMPNKIELNNIADLEKSSFAKELENLSKEEEIVNKNMQNNANKYEINEKLLREQTDNFEAFMIKSVLDISIKLENPLFGKDAGDDIYGSMYNDTMSKALSGGLGYSDLLFNFLKERV